MKGSLSIVGASIVNFIRGEVVFRSFEKRIPGLYYNEERVVHIHPSEFWGDYSKCQPFKPFQDLLSDVPGYRKAHRHTLKLLVVTVVKLEVARQAIF